MNSNEGSVSIDRAFFIRIIYSLTDALNAEARFIGAVHNTFLQVKSTFHNVIAKIEATIEINVFCIWRRECGVEGRCYTHNTFVIASPEKIYACLKGDVCDFQALRNTSTFH